jgi:hypothetical protein
MLGPVRYRPFSGTVTSLVAEIHQQKMGRPTGREPAGRTDANSLEIAALVER